MAQMLLQGEAVEWHHRCNDAKDHAAEAVEEAQEADAHRQAACTALEQVKAQLQEAQAAVKSVQASTCYRCAPAAVPVWVAAWGLCAVVSF